MGRLAIVLHTHCPYVEGFDTWPFGEEWLWEAVATSYLPVLDVLEETGAPVTVSLTPVLCDQLSAPGAIERCLAFVRDICAEAHRIDLAEAPPEAIATTTTARASVTAPGRSTGRNTTPIARRRLHVSMQLTSSPVCWCDCTAPASTRAHWSSARSTPSCSATGGTRGRSGCE